MDYIKEGNRLSFKEFNDWWAKKGNYTYLICSKNKEQIENLENHLKGLGYKFEVSHRNSAYWHHHSRKNFNIRVIPFLKKFYRTRDSNNFKQKYSNVYKIDFFYGMSFKFVLIEKHIVK